MMCRTWIVKGGFDSFQPLMAGRAQGKAYNDAAKGNRKRKLGMPYMSVFGAFVNGLGEEKVGTTGH